MTNGNPDKEDIIMKQIHEDFWRMSNSKTLKGKIIELKKLQNNIEEYLSVVQRR